MSDNELALARFNLSADVERLKLHASTTPADDDAGWEIQRLLDSPGFRGCNCNSGTHWAVCSQEDNSYCG